MKTSRLRRAASGTVLFILEYLFKFTAGVLALIVLAAEGSFWGKLGAGFGSLAGITRRIAGWPDQIAYLARVVSDYTSVTAAEFNRQYGGDAVNRVMDTLNEAVTYGQAVYHNLAVQPAATVGATLLAFLAFYLMARSCRFVRQRGRGSYIVRKERELGRRVFENKKPPHGV